MKKEQIKQLNNELYKALSDTLFSAGALRYMVSEKYPEIVTKYKMLLGSDYVIHDGKKGMRIPTVTDFIKDIDRVQRNINNLVLSMRMRLLKKGYDSEVTENIDYAIYMCQSALGNMEEDDIYREAARLSKKQVNIGDISEQIEFLKTLQECGDEGRRRRIEKRIEVLEDIYNSPLIFKNGIA